MGAYRLFLLKQDAKPATTEKYYYPDAERLQKVVDMNPLNTQNLNPEEQLNFIYNELQKFKVFKNLAVELKKDTKSVELKISLQPPL